jgi:hypothetical protein
VTSLLLSDDRAEFTAEHDERYTLGDGVTAALTLNAVDAHGCAWAAEVPEDDPEVTTPMDRRQDGDGGYAGEPTLEPLAVSVEGTVTAPTPSALRQAKARLWAALLGDRPAYLRWTLLDAEPARGLWVQPAGKPRWRVFDDRCADFAFVLSAEDPIWTGTADTYGPVRLPTVGGEGGYPMGAAGAVMPWTATGGTVAVTVAQVPNVGDEASHAVYTVTGPVPQPRVQLGDGSFVALAADLGALDTWQVDTAAGTSTVNGVNRFDAWAAGSVFPLIPPGGVEVRLRSGSGGQDQAAGLSILTAPSWKVS